MLINIHGIAVVFSDDSPGVLDPVAFGRLPEVRWGSRGQVATAVAFAGGRGVGEASAATSDVGTAAAATMGRRTTAATAIVQSTVLHLRMKFFGGVQVAAPVSARHLGCGWLEPLAALMGGMSAAFGGQTVLEDEDEEWETEINFPNFAMTRRAFLMSRFLKAVCRSRSSGKKSGFWTR